MSGLMFSDFRCFWSVLDKERMIFAEFNKELQISNDLLLGGRKVNNVSDMKTDNCAPSGDRYDRTGHREDKCTGKYRVRCAGNIGLADKHQIEWREAECYTKNIRHQTLDFTHRTSDIRLSDFTSAYRILNALVLPMSCLIALAPLAPHVYRPKRIAMKHFLQVKCERRKCGTERTKVILESASLPTRAKAKPQVRRERDAKQMKARGF
ncbi:uncharacterized protein HD556DRAFT_1310553 [Suillus plorans]|uniref:Uncharacterized protein n=1 Tax=Suillus plorans TaxID=116603 RepID=A0A9P7DET1_9AGAM|nr:uncharacterized protein HD556DRAFT_1310553 [Suillus plorans]KAG1790540.1 hypothetical protein HD556DRAFT_1310553 [Suillus plorans]